MKNEKYEIKSGLFKHFNVRLTNTEMCSLIKKDSNFTKKDFQL